jgi:regulator of replication initiation timing
MRQAFVVAMVSALTVLVTDWAFQSSLLRTLWPTIVIPADGAITTAPVTVRWEGPQPLLVTLIGNGERIKLGLRHSPLEIEERFFPRAGQYGIEVRSPVLGRFAWAERRFLVRPPRPLPLPEAIPDFGSALSQLSERITVLEDERQLLQGRTTSLFQENESLRGENSDLTVAVGELRAAQQQADQRLAAMEAQQVDLAREYQATLEENRQLRQRLESLPPCTTWGYVAYPRPQTIPPTRRVVLVSNSLGDVFRNQMECELTRRTDPTAATTCYCVGSPWGG